MKPPIFPYFPPRDLSDVCNSDSSEEDNSISAISLVNDLGFFFARAERPEKRKIAGVQPSALNAFAKAGASEEPSSVIKQRVVSGSSVCRTSGNASETA